MADSEHFDGLLHSPAPPIPLRNPLRRDLYFSSPRRHHNGTTLSSTESLAISKDAQQRLMSVPCAGGRDRPSTRRHGIADPIMLQETKAKTRTDFTQPRDGLSALDDEDKTFLASTRSSVVNALKRHSAYLDPVELSVVQGNDDYAKRQREIEVAVSKMRRSIDELESLSTISSYDGILRRNSTAERQAEDTKVEVWLQHGTINTVSPESDHTSHPEETLRPSHSRKRHALTIFPPTSPITGRSEYAPPHSPLNNGRDAYGNHISTNTRDYFTPELTLGQRTPRSRTEVTYEQNRIQVPHLRGGGDWWNTLGISQTEEQPKNNRLRIPGQSTKGKNPLGFQHPNGSSHVGNAPAMSDAHRDGQAFVVVEDDWPDEPDKELLDKQRDLHSNGLVRYAAGQFGSVQDRHRDNYAVSTPDTPPWPPTKVRAMYELPPEQNEETSHTYTLPDARNEPDPFVSRRRAETLISDASYSPRTQKRWDYGPPAGPPVLPAVPPPAPPKDSKPLSGIASSVGALPYSKNRYERPQSAAESYEEYPRDLQSLRLGESVSAVGYGTRYDAPAVTTQKVKQLSPEEFEAAQKVAQVEFRPLCQDIMIRYNAEISRVRRAHQLNQITPKQFKVQIDWNIENKNKALKHSAEISDYVILTNEFSILEALNTVDGYAIYHDMLNTTNPELWQKLVEQHRMAQTMQTPMPKSRQSSFTQARTVAGKITRFLLAAPSDPELKTYSTRRPLEAVLAADSIPLAWMDPMAAATFTGATNNEAWRTRRKKDKSKGKAPATSEGISTHDFAPSEATQSRLTGTTAVNSNTHRTGTTVVPPARPTGPTQHPHRPNNVIPVSNVRRRHSPGTNVASEVSMWPEGDSQGNWHVARRPREPKIRGGGEGEGGTKGHKKSKSVWRDILRAEVM